jgi:hypothetical protein
MLCAVVAASAQGCGASDGLDPQPDAGGPGGPMCDSDAPSLPAELVGNFIVAPAGCALDTAAPGLGYLWVDACGGAATFMPDGQQSAGIVRVDAARYLYEVAEGADFSSELRVLDEQRGTSPVISLQSTAADPRWEGWALRQRELTPAVAVPESRRKTDCATSETWSMLAFDGVAAGRVLVAPAERAYTTGDLAPSVYVFGSSATGVTVRWPEAQQRFYGSLVHYDGTSGTARHDVLSACAELDGAVELAWDGSTVIADVDWFVFDTTDLDGDGDRRDFVIRRTRYVLRADACG